MRGYRAVGAFDMYGFVCVERLMVVAHFVFFLNGVTFVYLQWIGGWVTCGTLLFLADYGEDLLFLLLNVVCSVWRGDI